MGYFHWSRLGTRDYNVSEINIVIFTIFDTKTGTIQDL